MFNEENKASPSKTPVHHTYEIGDRVKARTIKLSGSKEISDVFTVLDIENVPFDQIEFNPNIPEEVNETGVGHHQWLRLNTATGNLVSGAAVELANVM